MEVCQPYHLLHIVLPLICVLSYGKRAPERGFAWCVVAGTVTYALILFGLTMVLGHLQILRPELFRILLSLSAIGLSLLTLIALPSWGRFIRNIRYRPAWVDVLLTVSVAILGLIFYYQDVQDWAVGPTFFDSVSYHIPRALMWSWQGSFTPWRTGNWHQIGFPIAGDAMLQPLVFLGCGWLGGAYTSAVLALGAAASIYVVAKSYGLAARPALVSSLAFLSFPSIGLRVLDVNTDMAAAFPLLAGVALFRAAKTPDKAAFMFISLTGLGVAVKGYVLFPAIPITIALFYKNFFQTVRITRTLIGISLGTLCAGTFCLLSSLPVYYAFGSFYGGVEGVKFSALHSPWREIWRVTVANLLTWSAEPLGALPAAKKAGIFEFLHFKEIYEYWGLTTRWFPELRGAESRSGIFALVCLPWLILGVARGYRWLVLLLFVALYVSVTSTIAFNFSAPRFAVVALALFAILWGSRAASHPILVGLLLTASAALSLNFLRADRMTDPVPPYSEKREPFYEVGMRIRPEPLLIFNLGTQAFIAGRLGQWRFQPVDCPQDDTWSNFLRSLKKQSHWLMFSARSPEFEFQFGPIYKSNLGPVCGKIKQADFIEQLEAAGWSLDLKMGVDLQLWKATDSPS